jgi:hypothetical protein
MAILGPRLRNSVAVALVASLLCASWARAALPSSETKLMAVYLVKFLQFVDWPSDIFPASDSSITIAVLGTDPFGNVLDQAAEGETVNHRVLHVRRCKTLAETADCQVVFVSDSERAHFPHLLSELKGRKVLTVSDLEGFTTNCVFASISRPRTTLVFPSVPNSCS